MRTTIITACLLALLSGTGQAQRSTPPKGSFESYRPIGELRLWTFLQDDSTIGRLISTVSEVDEVDGRDAYVVRNQLSLDYTKVGGQVVLDVTGDYYYAADGSLLGNDINLKINDQEGGIRLEREGDSLVGTASRGDQETDASVGLPAGLFAIDNDMVDQYELYFALHGLEEGQVIDDSIFVPRDMRVAPLQGEVIGYTWQQLYQGVLDSVYVVRLRQPAAQELFINDDLHLRKINIPTRDMRVYLDVVRQKPEIEKKLEASFSIGRFVKLLPHYALYLVIGLLSAALFLGRAFRRKVVWYGLGVGAAAFVVIALVQLPLQKYLHAALYVPRMDGGTGAIGWAILSILPAGPIQEGLKLLSIGLVTRIRRASPEVLPFVGAMAGAGLGILEACYLDSVVPEAVLVSWALFERAFLILFHVSTGVLLGWAFARGGRTLGLTLLVTMLTNTVIRTLPALLPLRILDQGLLNLLMAFIVVVVAISALVVYRRVEAGH